MRIQYLSDLHFEFHADAGESFVASMDPNGVDRGWKFRDYRALQSLEEYVLVSQDTRRVEGTFVVHGATISVDAIYAE